MFNIDISSWDASSATKTQNMFRNATSFQDKYTCDDPDSGPSSTCEQSLLSDLTFSDAIQNCLSESPVFGECRMYGRASKYGTMPNWNTTLVTNMGGYMSSDSHVNKRFSQNGIFNGDISRWDTSHVTDMSTMFGNCTAFNQNISGWDVSLVTDLSSMFSGADSFNQDIGNWITSQVTELSFMFHSAKSFDQTMSAFDTSRSLYMEFMFFG